MAYKEDDGWFVQKVREKAEKKLEMPLKITDAELLAILDLQYKIEKEIHGS